MSERGPTGLDAVMGEWERPRRAADPVKGGLTAEAVCKSIAYQPLQSDQWAAMAISHTWRPSPGYAGRRYATRCTAKPA